MRKNAFTLAEVLITLVIIGVIAAMTIPTLMGSMNSQDIKSRLKKAVSEMNQAVSLDYALYGNYTIKNGEWVTKEKLYQMVANHISVIGNDGGTIITLSDGTRLNFWQDGYVTVFVDGSERYDGECTSAEQCEQFNPSMFTFSTWCGKINDHMLCPISAPGYAYIYDISMQEAYDKFGGNSIFW